MIAPYKCPSDRQPVIHQQALLHPHRAHCFHFVPIRSGLQLLVRQLCLSSNPSIYMYVNGSNQWDTSGRNDDDDDDDDNDNNNTTKEAKMTEQARS